MSAGLETIGFPTLAHLGGVICAHSTRRGGVSEGPFDSLNLGFSAGDDPERVRENRRRFFAALELEAAGVVAGAQVHGRGLRLVGRPERGRGALEPRGCLPEADGLLTLEPGVFLLALSADCPLIGLVAPPDRGVAVAHSGWRGVAGGMPGAAVAALEAATGVSPERMLAVVGPAIGPCCYPVGEEVHEALPPPARPAAGAPEARGRALDLRLAIRLLLEAAGVPAESIWTSPACSSCDGRRFYSYRRDRGVTGRTGLLVGLRG